MKFLYLLSFVVWCHGTPFDKPPTNVTLTTFQNGGDTGFIVRWNKVENSDETDPVLGYKVKIWEEHLSSASKIEQDGTLTPTETKEVPSTVTDGVQTPEVRSEDVKSTVTDGVQTPEGTSEDVKPSEYRINVWRGEIKVVEKLIPVRIKDPSQTDDLPVLPVTEKEVPADKTELTFPKMEIQVLYKVAVQAFTAKAVGPLSDSVTTTL